MSGYQGEGLQCLRLRVRGITGIRARVLVAPVSFQMAVGVSIEGGWVEGKSGRETRIMCAYDREPWWMNETISTDQAEVELLVFHVQLAQGEDWWLPGMEVRYKVLDAEKGVYQVKGKTLFPGDDEFFVFLFWVFGDSMEVVG